MLSVEGDYIKYTSKSNTFFNADVGKCKKVYCVLTQAYFSLVSFGEILSWNNQKQQETLEEVTLSSFYRFNFELYKR